MFGDSLIVGLIVLLLCGAAFFYMYVRMTFLEKKFVVMESILVDLRVAMDSLLMEHMAQPAAPIAMTPGVPLPPVASEESNDSIPEEQFYRSVLEQAQTEDAEAANEGVSADAALESFATQAPELPEDTAPEPVKSAEPDLDGMNRQDLITLAESKGLRVKRSMNRNEIINLLRRTEPTQNQVIPTGAENVSGSTGSIQQLGASLDGTGSVGLDQNNFAQ